LQLKRPFEGLYNTLLKRAKDRGILASLTYEEFLRFTEVTNCHYCGSEIPWITHGRKAQNGGYHIDRKDSDLGYTKENSVVACGICNRIKNNHLSYEEMLRLSPVLREIMAGRQQEIR
jgi:hypothetical protein